MIKQERKLVDLLSGYKSAFLVANNPDVKTNDLSENAPEDSLFVFYNAANVVSATFRRPSLICHRSSFSGGFALSQRTRSNAEAKFGQGSVKATVRVLVGERGDVNEPPAFGPQEHVMLTAPLHIGWYSMGKMPTIGFASVLWFLKNTPDLQLNLVGFSGAINPQFKMDTLSHDWVLEQAVMQIEEQRGSLAQLDRSASTASMTRALERRYPDLATAELAVVCADVLSRRQYAADSVLGAIWRRVHPLRELHRRTVRLLPARLWHRSGSG